MYLNNAYFGNGRTELKMRRFVISRKSAKGFNHQWSGCSYGKLKSTECTIRIDMESTVRRRDCGYKVDG